MKIYNTIKVAGMSALIGILELSSEGVNAKHIKELKKEYLERKSERYDIWKEAVYSIPYQDWIKASQEFERKLKKNLENKLNSIWNSLKSNSDREIEESIPNIRKIKEGIKYSNGPTRFAGELYNNDKVKIIERNGKEIDSVEGLASFYSRRKGGRGSKRTATGALFHDNLLTLAVNERLGYRIPCIVKITNSENGKQVFAVANDYGPYMFDSNGMAEMDGDFYIPHDKRIIDLSPALKKQLESDGLTKVKVECIGELKIK